MRRLPFLNGIKAFEAAARTGSFVKAADELHVSPAAVSRMVHLLEDRLGLPPICTPALARKLKKPDDLRGMTLLRVTHAADDWPRWFKAVGLTGIQPKGLKFDYYGHAQQAAADGVGVAIGVRPYIDDDLSAGRLVTPFAQSVPKDASWYLV